MCRSCEVVFNRHSTPLHAFIRTPSGRLWFCSPECRQHHQRERAGREPNPAIGEMIEYGFVLMHAAENGG